MELKRLSVEWTRAVRIMGSTKRWWKEWKGLRKRARKSRRQEKSYTVPPVHSTRSYMKTCLDTRRRTRPRSRLPQLQKNRLLNGLAEKSVAGKTPVTKHTITEKQQEDGNIAW